MRNRRHFRRSLSPGERPSIVGALVRVYGNAHDYDFVIELEESLGRADRIKRQATGSPVDQLAGDEYMLRTATSGLFRETTYGYGRPLNSKRPAELKIAPAPVPEQLTKHTARYGEEGVTDVQRIYDEARPASVELSLESFRSTEPQGRYTTPELVETVQHLAGRGFGLMTIADVLNLKDYRVRRLLSAAGAVSTTA